MSKMLADAKMLPWICDHSLDEHAVSSHHDDDSRMAGLCHPDDEMHSEVYPLLEPVEDLWNKLDTHMLLK